MHLRTLALTLPFIVIPLAAHAEYPAMDLLRERGNFESATLSESGFEVQDDASDTFVFTPTGAAGTLGLHADIVRASMQPGENAWNVTVELREALPADPGMPVNIDFFVADESRPVAPTGVFRAGINRAFMLLFGTRTKWHVDTWSYDVPSGRWNKENVPVTFSATGSTMRMSIPYSALARDTRGTVRFFSLTSQSGTTAVDIAPGKALPPLRETKAPTMRERKTLLPRIGAGIAGLVVVILAGWIILRQKRAA